MVNQEEIVCAWSLITYSFLSPIAWMAYRKPHIPYDKLPPLSDVNRLRSLASQASPVSIVSYTYTNAILTSSNRCSTVPADILPSTLSESSVSIQS